LREAVVLRPDLFSTTDSHMCSAGTVEQRLSFARASALIDVLSVDGGPALRKFDAEAMNSFYPTWRSSAANVAREWSPIPNDPLGFFVSPRSPSNQALRVRYVRNPKTYGLAETITDLPEIYRPALVAYVVYRAESKDDEHVLSARAGAANAIFKNMFKG